MAFGRGPKIVKDNLVLMLDAANPKSYPGTGTTWYDLSGNGNHFSLVNGVSFNSEGYFTTDGVNDHIKSTNTVDLSSYDYVVVDIWLKSLDDTTFQQAFEHSNNWNTNSGGFGLFIHNNGSGFVKNENHTNHKDQIARNYVVTMNENWINHVNLYAGIPDSTGRQTWTNGSSEAYDGRVDYSGNGTTSSTVSFRNDTFYMGGRGGASLFGQAGYSSFKVYGFKFSDGDVLQNYNALKGRFGL